MECENYVENGRGWLSAAARAGRSRAQHELDAGGSRRLLQLGGPALAGRATGFAIGSAMVPAHQNHDAQRVAPTDAPFMNNMDGITYWIYTKRAPCLMSYDNVKKRNEEAQCSKPKLKSVPSAGAVPSPKKKKRKLSLLDDDSGSVEKQQNVYFDTSQKQKQTVISSCKSDTLGSDIDFNIKNTSVQEKTKRSKLQKSNRTTLHKKNKVITSTPKVQNLRRSVRQAKQSLINNSQLNSSFEIFNTSVLNGNSHKHSGKEHKSIKVKKNSELLAGGDQSVDNKKNAILHKFIKSRNEVLNGLNEFEDLSDVSGFTANYIRSTKLQSTKTPRKLRCKNTRNLVKESKQSTQKESTMVVFVNKSVNTDVVHKPTALNCSTESENVINLVTKGTEKSTKVTKSTSLLKFMDAKSSKSKECASHNKLDSSRTRGKAHLNVSFQSQGNTSRYPKRFRNHTQEIIEENPENPNQTDKRRKISKNSSDFNNSDRKENPEETAVSRTRSGRNIGLTLRHPENSVLVLSNSTEHVSSMVSMNVASPGTEQRDTLKKKKRITRHLRSKKSRNRQTSIQRDSLRDKSGFSACFSDSDDDSEPLKQRKFFCA